MGVGDRYGIITSRQVRYEGILDSINEEEFTLTLRNVKCFGTENRDLVHKIPEKAQIYSYITFQGADLIDITLCYQNTNCVASFDSAIVDCGESIDIEDEMLDTANKINQLHISQIPTSKPKPSFSKLEHTSCPSVEIPIRDRTINKEPVNHETKEPPAHIPEEGNLTASSNKIHVSDRPPSRPKSTKNGSSRQEPKRPVACREFDFGANNRINHHNDSAEPNSAKIGTYLTEDSGNAGKAFDPSRSFFDDLSYDTLTPKTNPRPGPPHYWNHRGGGDRFRIRNAPDRHRGSRGRGGTRRGRYSTTTTNSSGYSDQPSHYKVGPSSPNNKPLRDLCS